MGAGYRKTTARATERKGEKVKRFGKPLAEIVEDADIPATARLVYCILCCRADGRSGVAKISVSEIARHVGIQPRAAKKAIRLLREIGAIERLSRERVSGVWQVKIGGGGSDKPSRENGSDAFRRAAEGEK